MYECTSIIESKQSQDSQKITKSLKHQNRNLRVFEVEGSYNRGFVCREVSEWLKEHAWNACKVQAFEGSNPFLSAIASM